MPAPRSAIVLVIDRLGAGFLGPYGATWVETPSFNRLAAQSLLGEFVLADSPQLARVCRSYWTGLHAAAPDDMAPRLFLPAAAQQAGLQAVLLTDDAAMVSHPLSQAWSLTLHAPAAAAEQQAEVVEETALATLLQVAADWLSEARAPFFLWVHAQGPAGPWDAPQSLRQRYADEEDPTPPEFVAPPQQRLEEGYDPDELLGLTQAYAGQVTAIDEALGGFLDAVDALPAAREAALVVTSPRGYPLGEHRRVGPCDQALYGELLQVPLFIRAAEGARRCDRTRQLLQPADLLPTLCDLCGLAEAAIPPEASALADVRGGGWRRPTALSMEGSQRSIRTPAWFLREDAATGQRELFAKPDDRWEVNEVASRCGEVAEQLAEEMTARLAALAAGGFAESPPLPELLAVPRH